MDQETLTTSTLGGPIVKPNGAAPTSVTLAQKQKAEMAVAHLDCDTIPFLWSWAKNFALFDNFHQTIVGPSTPNAIAMIAGQAGQTQAALHSNELPTVTYSNAAFPNPLGATFTSTVAGNSNAFVPIVADPGPFPGSNKDTSATKPPYNFDENAANPTVNQTYATQPLSFMGSNIGQIIKSDQNPRADLIDVQHDIFTIATKNQAVNWGWYQQGFNGNDRADPYEPQGTGTPNPTNDPSLYTGYVLHHNGPAYFGYLADNTQVLANNLHGAQDLLTAVTNQTLPATGGVFYYRGGYSNNLGLTPVNPTPAIQHAFIGNDDHPGYSDRQVSEAFAAQMVSAIANSPYWNQSAIVITYDETDGQYDHEQVANRNTFVDGSPLAGGPRIPTIVISPWSLQGTISHQYSEHGSVIKFINELYNLVPLAQLPDEAHGTQLAQQNLGQSNYGPSDDPANNLGDLTEVFDYTRMQNNTPISPSVATFSTAQITTLPHLATANYSPNGYTNGACQAIGILPTDFPSVAAYQGRSADRPLPARRQPAVRQLARHTHHRWLDAVIPPSSPEEGGNPALFPSFQGPLVQRLRFALPLAALLLPHLLHAQPAPAATPKPAFDAEHTLDAVKSAGRLSCGTIEAVEDWNGQDQHGDLSSLSEVICHAVAAAIFGDADKVTVITVPGEPEALAAVHTGTVHLAVGVSPSAENAMQWGVAFGPPVFYDTERLMVLAQAGLKGAADLSGKLICAMDGTDADRTLRDEMTRRGIPYALQAHSEQGEMDESVAVARCAAGAALESRLADSRADFPARAPEFVFLPERFGLDPIAPAWRYGDQRFGLIVQYTIDALIEAEALGITQDNVEAARSRTDMRARRLLGADRSVAQALGLAPDWAVRVIAAEGNYGEIFSRTVGKKLRLERGLNALWTAGGLMRPSPMQ